MEPVEINLGLYYLRALRADEHIDDRPAVLEGFADPDTRRWVPGYQIDDLADAGAYIARRTREWARDVRYSWAVADPFTGELLGEVGLKELDLTAGTAEAACWTHPAGRGRGMASRALAAALRFGFGAVGLKCVVYRHFSSNLASARVAEKCGFLVTDQVEQAELGDGTEERVVVRLLTRD
ncbi:MAG TPA: GNAT family N-acetyltransferase [Actinophytocola sp.]|uniref:GNAT family N-acetyltransferase n=1 Tax=Actinophytocola sp. TaxID=1872138 RepID=UPI002DDD58A6|nr:GNAT family N-acetyltransferase [Actinophytocola sp.]HEV2784659.1 GNAT family N-acetyltransferase [Actinophytocola sp.]